MTIDEFRTLDLRIGNVLAAERVPNAQKLLRLEVDLGGERRQIVAGIAEEYAPEALLGRAIVVVANLEPRTIRGVESHGMLLAACGEEGVRALLTVDAPVPPGTKVS